jgi:hypothetical protein
MSEEMKLGPFTSEEIQNFLLECGFTGNPEGLAQPFQVECDSENPNLAYVDINADAVRKGREVPDRPVRITFRKIFDGAFPSWKLKSADELPPGVKSNALDRHKDTPKVSSWPDLDLEAEKPCRECGTGTLRAAASAVGLRCDSCAAQFPYHGKPPVFPEPPGHR